MERFKKPEVQKQILVVDDLVEKTTQSKEFQALVISSRESKRSIIAFERQSAPIA